MAIVPQSSMPIPTWFLRQTATINTQIASQETAGSWDQADSTTYTCLCNLQPISTNDSAIYRKETSTTLYNLFLHPACVDGTATASLINKTTTFSVDGVVYKMSGEALNLCSNDVIVQCGVYREA